MARLLSLLLVALGLVSCAVSATPIQGPSGAPGFRIECFSNQEDCNQEAGRQCGQKGYRLVSEDSELSWGMRRQYSMTFECGR